MALPGLHFFVRDACSFELSYLNLRRFRPELIGIVGDVLLVATSDRLVFYLAMTLPAIAHMANRLLHDRRSYAVLDHVIALDDSTDMRAVILLPRRIS